MTNTVSVPAPMEPFRIEVEPERDAVRVVPVGELDLVTVPELAEQLQELRDVGFERLVLDLRRLEFIDCTGLHLILKLDAEARRDGHELIMIPGPPRIQRVFEMAGVSEHLPLQHQSAASEQDRKPRTPIGARRASARDATQLQRFIAELHRQPRRAPSANPAVAHGARPSHSSPSHSSSVLNLGQPGEASVSGAPGFYGTPPGNHLEEGVQANERGK